MKGGAHDRRTQAAAGMVCVPESGEDQEGYAMQALLTGRKSAASA